MASKAANEIDYEQNMQVFLGISTKSVEICGAPTMCPLERSLWLRTLSACDPPILGSLDCLELHVMRLPCRQNRP